MGLTSYVALFIHQRWVLAFSPEKYRIIIMQDFVIVRNIRWGKICLRHTSEQFLITRTIIPRCSFNHGKEFRLKARVVAKLLNLNRTFIWDQAMDSSNILSLAVEEKIKTPKNLSYYLWMENTLIIIVIGHGWTYILHSFKIVNIHQVVLFYLCINQ